MKKVTIFVVTYIFGLLVFANENTNEGCLLQLESEFATAQEIILQRKDKNSFKNNYEFYDGTHGPISRIPIFRQVVATISGSISTGLNGIANGMSSKSTRQAYASLFEVIEYGSEAKKVDKKRLAKKVYNSYLNRYYRYDGRDKDAINEVKKADRDGLANLTAALGQDGLLCEIGMTDITGSQETGSVFLVLGHLIKFIGDEDPATSIRETYCPNGCVGNGENQR